MVCTLTHRNWFWGLATFAQVISFAACASAPPASPVITPAPVVKPAPVAPPIPTPPALPMHPLEFLGAWGDHSADTKAFTNVATVAPGCADDAAFADATAAVSGETRNLIVQANLFRYEPTPRSRGGYVLHRECWPELREFIGAYRARVSRVWLLDEPDAVAWGDAANGLRDVGYTNIYNEDIGAAVAMIKDEFPDMPVCVNYAGVQDGLVVPASLDCVGFESYNADWRDGLAKLAGKTNAPLVLIARMFGDSAHDDATVASMLADECADAFLLPRVSGLLAFVWSGDDANFYTPSGGTMPRTRAAFMACKPVQK